MTRVKTILPVVLAVQLVLSGCNFPAAQGVQEPEANALMLSVSLVTEVRTGPGQVYDVVGLLNPGQEVEAVGISPDGQYWQVRDPANPEVLRWLKKDFATVSGNPIGLPISTPPPTPTLVSGAEWASGCPTPIGGGPTPVSCNVSGGDSSSAGGCPTPIGGGPTPVSCDASGGDSSSAGGCPTPIGGGPTPVSCPPSVGNPTRLRGPITVPTPVR